MTRWLRKLLRIAASLLLCAVPAAIQAAGGTISGTVRSAKTGEPLKSVQVSLSVASDSGTAPLHATTGPAGEFLYTELPAGQYRLQFRKSGYRKLPARAEIVSVTDDEDVPGLDVGLVPAAVISGHVVDVEREPVPTARVHAYALRHRGDRIILSPAARAQADDLGEYRLYNLAAGKYVISASPPRLRTPAGEFYAGVADVYYPDTVSPAQSTPLHLLWGQELTGIDLELPDEPAYSVSGVAFESGSGGGCFDCVMQIARLDGRLVQMLSKQSRISAEGVFLVTGLSAGTYKLSVRQAGDRRSVGQSVVQVNDRNLDDVVLIASLGRAVAGKIVFEEEAAVEPGEEMTVSLFPLNAVAWPLPRTKAQQDFTFVFQAVPSEVYRLEVQPLPPGAYLKTLRLGGQPLPSPELTVPEDAPVAGVQAVIGFDAATVSGRVKPRRSGGGKEGPIEARVALIPKPNQGGYVRAKTVQTAPDGGFSFASVVPGAYTLYALSALSSAQLMDPAVQASLRSFSRQLDLDPAESATVELPLGPDPE